MFQMLLEFVLAAVLVVTVLTQVAWPMIKGTKLFPAFRKDLSKASDKVVEAEQEAEVKELEQRAKDINAATKQTYTSKKG